MNAQRLQKKSNGQGCRSNLGVQSLSLYILNADVPIDKTLALKMMLDASCTVVSCW